MYDGFGPGPEENTPNSVSVGGRIKQFFVNFFDRETSREETEEKQWREKTNFTKDEIRKIKAAVNTADESSLFITIMGMAFPVPGHIYRLKNTANYHLFKPQSLVIVISIELSKYFWTMKEFPVEVICCGLDEEGKLLTLPPLPIAIEDLEKVGNEVEIRARWLTPPQSLVSPFADGDAVETIDEIVIARQGMGGAVTLKLPRGLKGVVEAPEVQTGASIAEINSPRRLDAAPVATYYRIVLNDGQSVHDLHRRVISIPLHITGNAKSIYIPKFRDNINLQLSQIKKREFDRTLLDRVVMSDTTRQQILWLADAKAEDLRKWNITSFQKGTGKIILAYGLPGTGKTMTGEALAEYLGRPLYLVDSSDLGVYTSMFEDKFKQMITRTSRWNSVTVVDESEAILQSRDLGNGDNARVQAVLRNLELLEQGMLWLTTNRPFDIDPAIDSRILLQVHFPFLGPTERRKVWEFTLPEGVPTETDGREQLLDRLSEKVLNGREIRKTIVNAAYMASSDGLEGIPGEYLVRAADIIIENQKILEEAKSQGTRRRSDSNNPTGQYL